MKDNELIRQCKAKDRVAQKALYERYSPMVYGVCLRYLSNQFDAADCLQKSFLKVYAHLDQVKSESSFSGWIKTLTIRTCLDHIKSRSKLKFDPIENYKEIEYGYVEDYDLNESQVGYTDLLKLIDLMPEGYRTVFNLAIMDGLTHEDIAIVCGISKGTSRSQLHKARRYLQSLITTHYGKIRFKV